MIIAVTAFGNIYFQDQYSTPIRVVAVVVLLLISLGVAAMTNQGRKALGFFKDSRTELRKNRMANPSGSNSNNLYGCWCDSVCVVDSLGIRFNHCTHYYFFNRLEILK